jgi:hypothetical protein
MGRGKRLEIGGDGGKTDQVRRRTGGMLAGGGRWPVECKGGHGYLDYRSRMAMSPPTWCKTHAVTGKTILELFFENLIKKDQINRFTSEIEEL